MGQKLMIFLSINFDKIINVKMSNEQIESNTFTFVGTGKALQPFMYTC